MPTLSQRNAGETAAPEADAPGSSLIRLLSRFLQALPVAARVRIGLLFGSLVLIKLVLLFSLSKHLYEMHWRVTGEPESWLNYAAFFGFVALGVFGLLSFATHCQQKGLGSLRATNAAVVCLGILFIFFTFHTADKNYLYPIMTRTLKWSSLIPYLSLDLFFRPPFLAAWLLGYAFVYYLMARTGREIWTLHLTALVAAAYGLVCLRELRFFRDELLVIDCIGNACLLGSEESRRFLARAFHLLFGALIDTRALARCEFGSGASSRFNGFISPPEEPSKRLLSYHPFSHRAEAAVSMREPPILKSCGLDLLWLFVPSLWVALYCMLLALVAPEIRELDLYFRLLLGGTIIFFVGLALWARQYDLFRAWTRLSPFFFTAFLLLANAYYPAAHNYNNSLCLALQFPHYFLGELSLALALAGCAWIYHRAWPKAGFRWLDIINLVLVAIAVVDLRLSQIMGVRLEWDVLTFGNSPKMMWRMAKPYLPSVVLGLAAVVLLYALALHAIQWWFQRRFGRPGEITCAPLDPVREPQSSPSPPSEERSGERRPFPIESTMNCRRRRKETLINGGWGETESIRVSLRRLLQGSGLCFAVASFLLLAVLGWATATADKAEGESALRLAASSPLWSRALNRTLSPEEFRKTANELGLGTLDAANAQTGLQQPRDLNVLVVFMESSYNKYLSLFGSEYETQPLLSKYRDRMEIFPNFFSDFASSIHARFATFTSLYPVRDYNAFTLRPVKVKSLFEVLHENGYTCSMFYSSFFDYTGFGDFLKGRGIDEMFDANNMPGANAGENVSWGLKEETTLKAMRNQIKHYAQDKRRFFLTYVPAAPHYPYDNIPTQFRKFKKVEMNDYTPVYLNELLYMDWVLASIVDQLQESGLLDHTLVIITNDHGEMLGGKGGAIGHGWAFTPELANTPLIVMDPLNPGWHVNHTIGSQVDFLPSVLDRLNLPLPAGQLYQGRSLYKPSDGENRRIYLNTCQQFGVLRGNQIFVGDRDSGKTGGSGSKITPFTLSNQGAKTVFTESHPPELTAVSIQPFDDFQENLLRNYSLYCQSVCKKNNLAKPGSREAGSSLVRASRQ